MVVAFDMGLNDGRQLELPAERLVDARHAGFPRTLPWKFLGPGYSSFTEGYLNMLVLSTTRVSTLTGVLAELRK
jgi:hypothetical protein